VVYALFITTLILRSGISKMFTNAIKSFSPQEIR
jgi:hypothetical protein